MRFLDLCRPSADRQLADGVVAKKSSWPSVGDLWARWCLSCQSPKRGMTIGTSTFATPRDWSLWSLLSAGISHGTMKKRVERAGEAAAADFALKSCVLPSRARPTAPDGGGQVGGGYRSGVATIKRVNSTLIPW